MNVQAYILNISGVKSFDEFMEIAGNSYMHTADAVVNHKETAFYTAPRWIMDNDIVFFYHAKTAKTDNNKLRKYIKNNLDMFEDGIEKDLFEYLDYFDDLYNKYGGKIYAVGRICGDAIHDNPDYEFPHFKSKIFAPIINIEKLDYPLSADKFEEFLPIAKQSGITPVLGNDFVKLKSLILRYNENPYLEKCTSISTPLREVRKGNWIQAANENKRRYFLEWQFRKYYVDFLLMSISDNGKIYTECSCYKNSSLSGIVDNCILINGVYLFVEVKLNINTEKDLIGQVEKYCNVAKAELDKKTSVNESDIFQKSVLVVDTNKIFMYNSDSRKFDLIEILDNIKCMADVRKLKNRLIEEHGI